MASLGSSAGTVSSVSMTVVAAGLIPAAGVLLDTDVVLVQPEEGGTPVDPKRFLNVGGTAIPIQ
jgi:hypothetical protein